MPYSIILRHIKTWSIALYRLDIAVPLAIHMEELIAVLIGSLGFGGQRTFVKISGGALGPLPEVLPVAVF